MGTAIRRGHSGARAFAAVRGAHGAADRRERERRLHRSSVELRELRRLQIALVLPHRFSHATPVISAYVARRHRDGIGVEWCDFAPQAVVELLRSPAARSRNRPPSGRTTIPR